MLKPLLPREKSGIRLQKLLNNTPPPCSGRGIVKLSLRLRRNYTTIKAMATLKQIIETRLKKRKILKEQKREPYPIFTKITHSTARALAEYSVLAKEKKNIKLAGRV